MNKDYPTQGIETIFDKKYGRVYIMPAEKIMICELREPYIPIEKFQKIFNFMREVVKEYHVQKFIFDKRHLRAFHQPSMEWYFVDWKQDMLTFGLKVHRKILPQGEPWFKDAVEAGRARIVEKHGTAIIDNLDIAYRESIEEAIAS